MAPSGANGCVRVMSGKWLNDKSTISLLLPKTTMTAESVDDPCLELTRDAQVALAEFATEATRALICGREMHSLLDCIRCIGVFRTSEEIT